MLVRQLLRSALFCVPIGLLGAGITGVVPGAAQAQEAEDWPSFRHDLARSGTTSEQLDAGRLDEAWVYQAPEAPLPAWPGPARWDAYAGIKNLPSMRNFDPCYHVIAVGDAVYFGSSTDDSVHRLNATTGEHDWTFTTDGPVRLAPMFVDGRLYFGSDDGAGYCINADTGELVWRHQANPDGGSVINNGRAISFHPVRTGVLVRDGVAYFGASLLPWKESYLVGVDALTGEEGGPGTFTQRFNGQTMEGAMLATDAELIIPQGRVAPRRYNRATGASSGTLSGGGGVFVVITEDQHILHGPGGGRVGAIQGNDKIAQFQRGHSLVVSGNWGFLLDLDAVIAIDITTGDQVWRTALEDPSDVILAGTTLFVGSRGKVTAFNAEDGVKQWQSDVDGRAFGMAVANGALLVSTDAGAIYAYRETGSASPVTEAGEGDETEPIEVQPSPEVENVRARGLAGRWVFHRSAMRDRDGASIETNDVSGIGIRDQAGDVHGLLHGAGSVERFGDLEALSFDGQTYVELSTDLAQANLPRRQFTVEAWVRIDEAMAWGGIAGCMRDNGADEKGWLLGFRDDKFSLALNSEQGGAMTYMTANTSFVTGGWAHVVGTYDGRTMRLYVNGRFETSSEDQGGDIAYPDVGHYVIGAYKDENEDFRMRGMVHEVRVYQMALRDRDIAALFRAKADNFPQPESSSEGQGNFLASGPFLRFTGPGTATVTWQTARPSTGSIAFIRDDQRIEVASDARGTDHSVEVSGLSAHAVYQYQVTQKNGSEERTTRSFECDTFFNYYSEATLQDSPFFNAEAFAPEAQQALTHIADHKGFAIVVGGPDAHFAYDLAMGSDLNVICLLSDQDAVAEHRRELVTMGLYGRRITVLHADDVEGSALPALFANAVVIDPRVEDAGAIAGSSKAILQPGGVLVHRADLLWTAPPIEGAGDWSHMYGNAENSSYGGESLANAANTTDLEVQWVGRPGPRYQSDRQNRKPAPLAAGGRLYMQGLQRIICVDQYNGTILWSVEIPEMQRWNVTRDCANWCADDDNLYVAVLDEMWKIEGTTGQVLEVIRAPGNRTAERTFDWGFVARAGDVLLGSSVKAGAIYTEWWGGVNWYDQADGARAAKVASDVIFAVDPETGQQRWDYDGSLILNATICTGEGKVFFVESRSREIIRGETRRLQSDAMWEDLHLVALDLETGRRVWDKPVSPMAGTTAFYLVYSQGKLVLSSSSNNTFAVYAIESDDGAYAWDTSFAWQANHHGKHLARPAIVGNHVFLRPKVLDLQNGSQLNVTFPDGHQCGSYTLTDNAAFARAGNITMWSVDDAPAAPTQWNRLRPDCWISTIPAGGMLLSPEGGGGCSCGSWIETSLGFMPNATREAAEERGE